MQIGRYTPRYKPNQTSDFSMLRSIGSVSAAQDKPFPNKPRRAEDISEVVPAVAFSEPPSIAAAEGKQADAAVPPPSLFDALNAYKGEVYQAYGDYQATFAQPQQDAMLSKGNWGSNSPAFMPAQYTPAVKALAPVASTPIDMNQLASLLSPETTQEGAMPYSDPTLAQHAQQYTQRAGSARQKADEYRKKRPWIRRFIPILNNALNIDEAAYRDMASRYYAIALDADTNALKGGQMFRQQQRAEAAARLAAHVGLNKQYTETLTAGYGTGAQAASIANDRARIDLARAATIANTSPMSILNIESLLKNAPNIMGMEQGLYEASPERRQQVVNAELARNAIADRMTESQIRSMNIAALNSGTEFADKQQQNESLADQALSHLQTYKTPDLRPWVETQTLMRQKVYEGNQTAAGKAMFNESLFDVASATFAADYVNANKMNESFLNDYFDNALNTIRQSTPEITTPQLELYTAKALERHLAQYLPDRIQQDGKQLQFSLQQIAKQIVQQYFDNQQQMMQAQ